MQKEEKKSGNIEDILKSVRSMIDQRTPLSDENSEEQPEEGQEEILELTSVVVPGKKDLISEKVQEEASKKIANFAKTVQTESRDGNTLDSLVENLVRPLIKDWVDNNLNNLVEKILREELKRIIPK